MSNDTEARDAWEAAALAAALAAVDRMVRDVARVSEALALQDAEAAAEREKVVRDEK